jgi:hypothetical protein
MRQSIRKATENLVEKMVIATCLVFLAIVIYTGYHVAQVEIGLFSGL